MDLAMPGMDGWATIQRIRREDLSDAHIAIVSANAFDKGLDNDAGVAAADFIVKPVRVAELLDWLGAKLQLQWLHAEPAATSPAPTSAAQLLRPPPAQLQVLEELVGLGYLRGILGKLDELDAEYPECATYLTQLRGLARSFQLEAVARLLRPASTHEPTA